MCPQYIQVGSYYCLTRYQRCTIATLPPLPLLVKYSLHRTDLLPRPCSPSTSLRILRRTSYYHKQRFRPQIKLTILQLCHDSHLLLKTLRLRPRASCQKQWPQCQIQLVNFLRRVTTSSCTSQEPSPLAKDQPPPNATPLAPSQVG